MIYIGIDVAKDSLIGVRIDSSSRVKEVFTFENTQTAIEKFLNTVSTKWKKITIASEATAEYHRVLALLCLERNIPFRLLNPITTKQFTRATVRKRKTDLTDAHVIAKLAQQGDGNLVTQESFSLTKPAIRTAAKLSKMRQQLLLMQQRLEKLAIEKALVEAIQHCMDTLESAKTSYEQHVFTRQDKRLAKLLQTIPGIGPIGAATLIAEVSDITKFSSGKALVAYCGLDPKVKQSGKGLHHNTQLTKRGSPYLRRAIFFAANIAELHNSELKSYYQKKRNEGKFYKEATIAVARKLLYRVYAVWKRQTPYVSE
jgi:transposase